MSNKKILVVEDEAEIKQLIVLHLKREGYEVDEVSGGEGAVRLLSEKEYQLVLLDWMLPGMSGLEITRWMRSKEKLQKTPVLMVTAKVEPENIAAGLDAGADDYLPKPFDTLVLMARVNALVRRSQWLKTQNEPNTQSSRILTIGVLTLKPDEYEIHLEESKMDLTKSEYKLLETLMHNQGKVLSRERLINEIQGSDVNVVGRTVDTHVFGLRKKLGAYGDLIETIRGIGYRVKYLEPQK
ncbi:MAG: response regulator transcription factor [Bdellovibrionales bacterium]|nr:response regulator transcription factor [Bdellovibrionales bacterium]